jgi:hypothetical protein
MRFTAIEIAIGLALILNVVSGILSTLTVEDSTEISAPSTNEIKSDFEFRSQSNITNRNNEYNQTTSSITKVIKMLLRI